MKVHLKEMNNGAVNYCSEQWNVSQVAYVKFGSRRKLLRDARLVVNMSPEAFVVWNIEVSKVGGSSCSSDASFVHMLWFQVSILLVFYEYDIFRRTI